MHENSENYFDPDVEDFLDFMEDNETLLNWMEEAEFVDRELKSADSLHNDITEWVNFSNLL